MLINSGKDPEVSIYEALAVAYKYGQNDGAHHLQWAIDQMVRALTGAGYEAWVAEYEGDPEDEENHYTWGTGIPA
jgi:hypothetical protein